MQTRNRLLDDLAKVAGGALSVMTGVKNEAEAVLRQQFEKVLNKMDLIPREDFEAVRAMAAKARDQQEELGKRVAALEAALKIKPPRKSTSKKTARKAATKKIAAKSAQKKSAAKKTTPKKAAPKKTARKAAPKKPATGTGKARTTKAKTPKAKTPKARTTKARTTKAKTTKARTTKARTPKAKGAKG